MKTHEKTSKAWYHFPFVWLVFGLPASAVIAGVITFYLAANTDDGLVDDDYYKHGKEINADLRRDQAAKQMGISAQVILSADGRNVRVMFNQAMHEAMQIKLLHPTRAGYDQVTPLTMQSPQLWSAVLPQSLEQKRWKIEVANLANSWRLRGEWRIHADEGLSLSSQ